MADELPGPHFVANLDGGIDRFVSGAQRIPTGRGVVDGDDGTAEEHPGVADGALTGSQNLLPRTTEKVDATMPGLPPLRGRLKAVDDHGSTCAGRWDERPGPGAGWVVGWVMVGWGRG